MAIQSLAANPVCFHCNKDLFVIPHWYAVYTSSRHEKKVAEQLVAKEITCFLPMREVERRWKNGKRALVRFPLFDGYVFVNISRSEGLKVLQTPGVVRLVGFNGLPEPIPEEQIYAMLTLVESKLDYDLYPYLRAGQKIRVKSGPLQGVHGILVRRKGRCKLALSVDLIRQSVALEVDADCVEPINELWKPEKYV